MENSREDIENALVAMIESSDERQLIDKLVMHLELMNRWLFIKNLGLDLKLYFARNHFSRVAIYGMADLGCRLLEELEHLGIQVAYGVDKRPLAVPARNRLDIILPDGPWQQDIDAVVVTPVFYYDEIRDMICDKVGCPIVSLKDIIWQI